MWCLQKGVRRISIYCESCEARILKQFCEIKERLIAVPSFKSSISLGLTCPIDSGLVDHVFMGNQKLDVAELLVYTGEKTPLIVVMT